MAETPIERQATAGRAVQGEASALLEDVYKRIRKELITYVTRLLVRQDIAEELVQETAARWIAAPNVPTDIDGARAWLFRVATNLAIDHRRRHSTWRENILLDTRELAIKDEEFLRCSGRMAGSPELKAIAKQHLAVCFACTIRNFPTEQGVVLLLTEVNGFSLKETAEILGLGGGQVKHALQSARASLRRKYGSACRLIGKEGVCHQCVELGRYFNGCDDDPLDGTARDIDARLAVLREQKETALGPWHQLMMRLIDELLQD
jgi:RNA polymerase sigma-70 factor, ECF subfamily